MLQYKSHPSLHRGYIMSVREYKTTSNLVPPSLAYRMSARGFYAGTIEKMRFKVIRTLKLGSREVHFRFYKSLKQTRRFIMNSSFSVSQISLYLMHKLLPFHWLRKDKL
jgi:hypothetical protein